MTGLIPGDTYRFELPVHRHRFMFHDGGTIDVLSSCDNSRLSEFAFNTYYGRASGSAKGPERIVGSADLGEERG